MRYWIARLLGHADGPDVTRCDVCGDYFERSRGVRAQGTTSRLCSEACGTEATSRAAY